MGASCSCFTVEDFEEHSHHNSSVLGRVIQKLSSAYNALFHRGVPVLPSSIQGVPPLASLGSVTPSLDTSVPDTSLAPPRPLPHDANPRFSQFQCGPVSRLEKASSHFHEGSEALRTIRLEVLRAGDKWNRADYEGGSKECRSEFPSTKVISGTENIFSSSEDEDVCPTCLEEYTTENPKIMTHCSHHFHLGCIYEWMKRSETCPVCCKVMLFDETT